MLQFERSKTYFQIPLLYRLQGKTYGTCPLLRIPFRCRIHPFDENVSWRRALFKTIKYLFLGLSLISATILTAGMSVPWIEVEGELAEKYKRLREIHNNVATIGFIMFFVTEVLFFITTLLRNPKQGMISVGMLAYVLMTSVIMLKLANLKGIVEHPYPISSIAQIHVFCSIGFTLTIQYFLMRLMPNTRIEMSEAAD